MFLSGEVRWFFEGSMPDDIGRWFGSGDDGHDEAARVDQYLLLPNCATTGVKVREGRLEVKSNMRAAEALGYADEISGYRDTWVKWSCKADDVEALMTMLGSTGDTWASVRKQRRLRKFSFDSGSPVEVDAAGMRIERGCQAEITSLAVYTSPIGTPPTDDEWADAAPWWSLSFEAFAPETPDIDTALIGQLDTVARLVFENAPPRPLPLSSSMAYPQWLLGVGQLRAEPVAG
jgi:hypothetical protein